MYEFGDDSDSTGLGTFFHVLEYTTPITLGPAALSDAYHYLSGSQGDSLAEQAGQIAANVTAPAVASLNQTSPSSHTLIPTWAKIGLGVTGFLVVGVSGILIATGIARKLHLI